LNAGACTPWLKDLANFASVILTHLPYRLFGIRRRLMSWTVTWGASFLLASLIATDAQFSH